MRLRWNLFLFCILFVINFILACASTETNIVSKDNGFFSVRASSYSTSNARKAAMNAAQEYCHKMGKRVALTNDSVSNALSQNEDDSMRDPAGSTFEKDRHPGISKPAEDSKVIIDFKCI